MIIYSVDTYGGPASGYGPKQPLRLLAGRAGPHNRAQSYTQQLLADLEQFLFQSANVLGLR